jgi:hypothetical protein
MNAHRTEKPSGAAHWLRRAAELLKEEAETLRQSYMIDGAWDTEEPEILERYREMTEASRAACEAASRCAPWNGMTPEKQDAFIREASGGIYEE